MKAFAAPSSDRSLHQVYSPPGNQFPQRVAKVHLSGLNIYAVITQIFYMYGVLLCRVWHHLPYLVSLRKDSDD